MSGSRSKKRAGPDKFRRQAPARGEVPPTGVASAQTHATKRSRYYHREVPHPSSASGLFPTHENIRTFERRQHTIWTGFRQFLFRVGELPGSCSRAVGDEPGEFRIRYIAEVMHGAPEFHRPWMFMFDERRESLGASFKQRCTYLSDESSSDTLSPKRGSDCQTIDVSAPSVPSADYRSDNLAIDRCDQK
jgi:hypothetical protein